MKVTTGHIVRGVSDDFIAYYVTWDGHSRFTLSSLPENSFIFDDYHMADNVAVEMNYRFPHIKFNVITQ